MPYIQNVETHHKILYNDNVKMVAQQLRNPLMNAVTTVPGGGLSMRVADLILKKKAVKVEARSRRNVETPATTTARWIVRPDQPVKSGQYIDREDLWAMAQDPTSAFMQADTAAVARAYADMVMGIEEVSNGVWQVTGGGILGTARDGLTGGTHGAATPTALPPAQSIAVGGTGLTLAKLRTAVLKLRQADFGIDFDMDPLYGALSPLQVDDLLSIAAAAGNNINQFSIDQLRTGKPTPLMGITWIMTNRLPKVGTTRTCPIWSKRNIIVAEWDPIHGDMWNDTGADNLPYMVTRFTADAVRAEDAGVIAIDCLDP
jgi:hypothetical protein